MRLKNINVVLKRKMFQMHAIPLTTIKNIKRAMESELRAVNIMNNRLWYLVGSYRRLAKFKQGTKDVQGIRKSKGITKLNYEVMTDPGHFYLQPVYTAVSPQLNPG